MHISQIFNTILRTDKEQQIILRVYCLREASQSLRLQACEFSVERFHGEELWGKRVLPLLHLDVGPRYQERSGVEGACGGEGQVQRGRIQANCSAKKSGSIASYSS